MCTNKESIFWKKLVKKPKGLTRDNRAKAKRRCGEGFESINQLVLYIDMRVAWNIKLNGLGFTPETSNAAPLEKKRPRLK